MHIYDHYLICAWVCCPGQLVLDPPGVDTNRDGFYANRQKNCQIVMNRTKAYGENSESLNKL